MLACTGEWTRGVEARKNNVDFAELIRKRYGSARNSRLYICLSIRRSRWQFSERCDPPRTQQPVDRISELCLSEMRRPDQAV